MEYRASKEVLLDPPDYEVLSQFSRSSGLYEVTDSGIYYTDLITHEPIEPGSLPPFLQGEEAKGWRQLKRLSDGQISIDFIQAPHGSAEDFEQIVAQFSDVLANHQFLGLEMSMEWSSDDPYGLPHETKRPYRIAASRDEFQRAQLLWCKQNDCLALPCERLAPSDDLLLQRLGGLWQLSGDITTNHALPDGTPLNHAMCNAVRMIVDNCYQLHRQVTFPEQLGRWLLRLEEEGHEFEGEQIGLILGSWHAPLANKLRGFGEVDVREYPLRGAPSANDFYGEHFKQTMSQGWTPHDSLRVPLPY